MPSIYIAMTPAELKEYADTIVPLAIIIWSFWLVGKTLP
jgi:hypothetical protein